MGDELAFAGAFRQAEMVRKHEISPRELVQLYLDRIARIDPRLNAFRVVLAEKALLEAEQAEARLRAGEERPLLGVPIALKDNHALADELTCNGTDAFPEPAAADDELVRRLREAGAIVIGKTHLPELAICGFSESATWGVSRNPWDPQRTPGGSSGGSAAAVAAGMVPAALAADGAGSIRIPAACCGLFGLKPQVDRVSRAPHDRDGSHWIVFGALTRSVLDTALVLDVIASRGPGGAADAAAPSSSFADAARARPGRLRIAVSSSFPRGTLGRLSPDVARALEETAGLLRSLGHEVVPGDLDFGATDAPVIMGLLFRGMHDFVAEIERPERLERRSRAMARPGAVIPDRLLDRLRERE